MRVPPPSLVREIHNPRVRSSRVNMLESVVPMEFAVETLGPCRYPTPFACTRYVTAEDRISFHSEMKLLRAAFEQHQEPPSFAMAGPRESLFFDPRQLSCAIVTCGGLCPGLNDVIRAIALSLHYLYGVQRVLGVPYGYQGLTPAVRQNLARAGPCAGGRRSPHGGDHAGLLARTAGRRRDGGHLGAESHRRAVRYRG